MLLQCSTTVMALQELQKQHSHSELPPFAADQNTAAGGSSRGPAAGAHAPVGKSKGSGVRMQMYNHCWSNCSNSQ